jgi:hypothetical protein
VALMNEVQREWERVYRRDGFESATCRHLADCGTSLSTAFRLESALRQRTPRVRPARHN